MVEAHYQLPSISYLPILLPIPYCRVLQGMVCMDGASYQLYSIRYLPLLIPIPYYIVLHL
jgi:hypothetical protein